MWRAEKHLLRHQCTRIWSTPIWVDRFWLFLDVWANCCNAFTRFPPSWLPMQQRRREVNGFGLFGVYTNSEWTAAEPLPGWTHRHSEASAKTDSPAGTIHFHRSQHVQLGAVSAAALSDPRASPSLWMNHRHSLITEPLSPKMPTHPPAISLTHAGFHYQTRPISTTRQSHP